MPAKTFAQYLIDNILPGDMHIDRQVDKSYLNKLLTEVARSYPDKFDETVSNLKRLADKMSTYEPITMGLDEISVPNKKERDAIVTKYTKLIDDARDSGDADKLVNAEGEFLDRLAECDLKGEHKDDATAMVNSALTGKKVQLQKLRTTPGLVADHNERPIPFVFDKSYAEGVDPLQFWLNGVDSRRNLATGQVAASKPGEIGKLLNNILCTAVVSQDDCGTNGGILLNVRDDDLIGRYLAKDVAQLKRNTLITADIQQQLLKSGLAQVLVRSPQTCTASNGSVCKKCMGIQNSTNKPYEIGTNAGTLAGGVLLEPMQQMVLSAKHSAIKAKEQDRLSAGEAAFRQLTFSPKEYKNRKVLCEVIGVIVRIRQAPQGGRYITIRQTRPVPDRYIVHAMKTPNLKMHWDYHIPPNLKLADGIEEGVEVYPGLALSTGMDDLKDISRLRNLGFLRSSASQNMYEIYKNSGNKMDRRHFELLARNAHPYVTIIKCPKNSFFSQGETVEYQKLTKAVKTMPKNTISTRMALGSVLAEPVLDLTVGTEIDAQVQKYLTQSQINAISVVPGLEVAASFTPLPSVVNKQEDWLAALNHRQLKRQLEDAASTGKVSDIHGYNPISAYAYGLEFGKGEQGRY